MEDRAKGLGETTEKEQSIRHAIEKMVLKGRANALAETTDQKPLTRLAVEEIELEDTKNTSQTQHSQGH